MKVEIKEKHQCRHHKEIPPWICKDLMITDGPHGAGFSYLCGKDKQKCVTEATEIIIKINKS